MQSRVVVVCKDHVVWQYDACCECNRSAQSKVLVHCKMGISRSASTVMHHTIPLSFHDRSSSWALVSQFPSGPFPPQSVQEKNLWGLAEHGFYGRMPFLPPNCQCQSTEGTQSTNPNQWSCLFPFLHHRTEGALPLKGRCPFAPVLQHQY